MKYQIVDSKTKILTLFFWFSLFFTSTLLAETKTAIIFDASHSMIEEKGPSGDQKLITAQSITKELINRSGSSGAKLPALLVFGSFNYSRKLKNCENIEIVSEGGVYSNTEADRLKSKIDEVDAKGRTPIYGALNKLAENLNTDKVNTAIVTDFVKDQICMPQIDCPALKKVLGFDSTNNTWRVRVKFLIVPGSTNTNGNSQLSSLSDCLGSEIIPIPNPDPDEMSKTIDRIFTQLNHFGSTAGSPLGSVIFESQLPSIPFLANNENQESYLISISDGSLVSAKFSELHKKSLPASDYTINAKWRNIATDETVIRVFPDEITRVSFRFPTASVSFHVVDRDGQKLDKQFVWRIDNLDSNESIEITTSHLQTALPLGKFRLVASNNGRTTTSKELTITQSSTVIDSLTLN